MGRSHDFYCLRSHFHWSPLMSPGCPEHGTEECSVYDLNLEAEEINPDTGEPWWKTWAADKAAAEGA